MKLLLLSRSVTALLPALLFTTTTAWAIDVTWDGGAAPGSVLWQTGGNWAGNAAPNANDVLIFDSTAGLANTNDFAADTQFDGVTFAATAGAFTLEGNRITLGGPVTNNSTTLQTIALDLLLNATRTFTLTTGGGNIRVNGSVSGSGGITLGGAGALTLAGNNSHAGNTAVGANQTVNLNSATALGTGALAIAGGSATAIFDNTSGAPLTLANGINLSGGSPAFAGTHNLTFNGAITLSANNRSITTTAGTLTFGGGVADDGSARRLTKLGAGTLVLNAAGTHGGTTLTEGLLRIGNDTALGVGGFTLGDTAIPLLEAVNGPRTLANNTTLVGTFGILGAQALTFNGTVTGSGGSRLLYTASQGLTTLAGNVFVSNDNTSTNRTLTIAGRGDVRIDGVIANNASGNTVAAGLVKTGPGTLTLTNTSTFTGGFTLNSGRVVLDLGTLTTGVLANRDVSYAGGTLEVRGASSGASSQTLANFGLTANTVLSRLVVNSNGGTGTNLTLGNTWTRGGTSYLLLDLSAPNTTITSQPVRVGGSDPNQNLIVGTGNTANIAAFMVRKSAGEYDFAARAAADTLIGTLGSTTALPASGGSASTAYLLASDLATTALVDASALRIDARTGSVTLTLGDTVRLTNFTTLIYGDNDVVLNGAGTLRGPDTNQAGIIARFGSGKLTINSGLGGTNGIQLMGEGLIDLNVASSLTGTNSLSGPTVRLSNNTGINPSSTTTGTGSGFVVLTGGAIVELTGTNWTRNLAGANTAGAFQFLGEGGFAAFGAARTVNISGTTSVTWGNTIGFLATGNALILGSAFSDNTVTFVEDINLGGVPREVRTLNGVNANDVDGVLSGVLTGSGGLTKTGAGTLELSGPSPYTGHTEVVAGRLLVSGNLSGTREVVVRSGGTLGGTGSITTSGNGDVRLAVGAALAPGGTGLLTAATLTLSLGSGVLDAAGAVAAPATGAFKFELGAIGASDRVALTAGTLSIGSGVLNFDDFSFTELPGFGAGTYTLVDSNNAIAGTLGGSLTGSIGSFTGTLGFADSGRDLVLTVVPEPGSAALLFGGLGLLGLRRRRG